MDSPLLALAASLRSWGHHHHIYCVIEILCIISQNNTLGNTHTFTCIMQRPDFLHRMEHVLCFQKICITQFRFFHPKCTLSQNGSHILDIRKGNNPKVTLQKCHLYISCSTVANVSYLHAAFVSINGRSLEYHM